MQDVINQIAEECGISSVSQAVTQLIVRAQEGALGDVRSVSEALTVLLSAGIRRGAQVIRDVSRQVLEQQDRQTGTWNNEVWDTALALMALSRAGLDTSNPRMQKAVGAIVEQFDEDEGAWWDLWETCHVIECFRLLGVETTRTDRALRWLVDKRYPLPEPNWLNIHTTAVALENLAQSVHKTDPRVQEARNWLEEAMLSRDLDVWPLCLALRGLRPYLGDDLPPTYQRKLDTLPDEIGKGELDTIDLCQSARTLMAYASLLLKPATRATVSRLAREDEQALSEMFVATTMARIVGEEELEREEQLQREEDYIVLLSVPRGQATAIGIRIGIVSLILGVVGVVLGILFRFVF